MLRYRIFSSTKAKENCERIIKNNGITGNNISTEFFIVQLVGKLKIV